MREKMLDVLRDSGVVAFFVTAAVLAITLILSVLMSIAPTVVTSEVASSVRTSYQAFIQQGWNFFTKDPESPQFGVYQRLSEHTVRNISTTPQTRVENLWGLSRTQRAQGPELAFLAATAKKNQWTKCAGRTLTCATSTTSTEIPVSVTNRSPVPTVCGEVIITQQHQSPWSYRTFMSVPIYLVDKYALFDVRCTPNGSNHGSN